MRVPPELLAELARFSASAWLARAERAFPGTIELETRTSVYTFLDGILVGRSRKPTFVFDTPPGSRCIRLVGFLADESTPGIVAFSPRWTDGARGLMLRIQARAPYRPRAVLLTSRTHALVREAPPVPASAVRLAPSPEPVSPERPSPSSCTRLFAAKAG